MLCIVTNSIAWWMILNIIFFENWSSEPICRYLHFSLSKKCFVLFYQVYFWNVLTLNIFDQCSTVVWFFGFRHFVCVCVSVCLHCMCMSVHKCADVPIGLNWPSVFLFIFCLTETVSCQICSSPISASLASQLPHLCLLPCLSSLSVVLGIQTLVPTLT